MDKSIVDLAKECGATKHVGVTNKMNGVVTEEYVTYAFSPNNLNAFAEELSKATIRKSLMVQEDKSK